MNKLISKIVGVCLGLSLATGVGVGVAIGNRDMAPVHAENDISITFPGSPSSYVNSYSKSFTITSNSITFTFASWNNGQQSDAWTSIRGGSKYGAWSGTITSGLIASKVQSVVVSVSSTTTNGGGASSLEVATNSDFTAGLQTISKVADSTIGDKTYTVTNPAENCYYRLTHNAAKGSANGEFRISAITFNYSSNVPPANTVSSVSISGAPSTTVTGVNVGSVGPTLTATPTMRTGSSTGATFTWTSSDETVATVSGGTLTYVGNGTTTISAECSLPAGATSGDTNIGTVSITTSNLIGSSTNPFTVAQALAVVAATGTTATTYDCYTSGIVSRIKTDETFNSQYGNKIFWFSADGTQTDEIEAFHCLYLDGEKMTEAQFNSITAGDSVTIVGKLVNYQGNTPEYTQGCYLTAHTKPVNQPQITITESSFTMNVGDPDVTLHETHSNVPTGGSVKWVSGTPAVASIGESTGVVHALSAGTSVITAKIVNSSDQTVASGTITVTVTNVSYPISDGDTFIIKCTNDGTTYYFTGVNSSNIGTYSTTKSDAVIITAEEGETSNQFYLGFNDAYLEYHGSDNKVFTSASKIDSALWTIVNDGTRLTIANVEITGRHFKFNTTSGSERFCCYLTESNIDVELVEAPQVDSVTVMGDSTADAEGAISISKEFLYEVTYVDPTNPGNGGVTVSVLNSNNETSGASVTAAPSNGSFTVTFTASDTYTVTVTSTEKPSESDSTTIVVSNIYVAVLTDYDLYEGTTVSGNAVLTEGDYVFYYNGCAMNTTIDSDRAQYEEVTPSSDTISTSDMSIIWHIAPKGDYYTIYNASENKYLASTGAKNKVQLLADGTDNKSLWSVSINNGTFDFVNKQNTTNGVNASLRLNGTYGFACYASTGTGGLLSLYKKAYSAVEYSNVLLNYLSDVCDATNGNTVVADLTMTWAILSAEYTLLDGSVKSALNSSSESARVLAALSAYDYVVGKYNKTQGVTAINDFMSRNPAAVGSARVPLDITGDNNAAIFALVAISMVTMTVVGAYFFLRKKKEVK